MFDESKLTVFRDFCHITHIMGMQR
jgi:hypothetical protein